VSHRSARPKTSASPQPAPRSSRTTVHLDALGLLRCRRAVLRGLADEVEVLRHVAALVESTASQVFVDTPADEVRAATTMVRVAAGQLVETSLCVASHLGALKVLTDLAAITVEEADIVEPRLRTTR